MSIHRFENGKMKEGIRMIKSIDELGGNNKSIRENRENA